MKPAHISRREFLQAAGTAAAAALLSPALTHAAAETAKTPELVVFSKIYQSLNLSYQESTRVTAAAGLQGVDAAVRPGGEVLPEKVTEDLPKYFEALRAVNLNMPLMATAITSTKTAHAETTLRVARRLGVRYYRLGPKHPAADQPLQQQVREFKAALKDLAAMNKELGIIGVLQNHSPSGKNSYFGGDLAQMRELLEGLDPQHLGMVFDIGHAVVVHGDKWRELFEPLKPHLSLIYLKDVKRPAKWLPMGEGEIHKTGFLDYLREIKYSAPISIHIEYDWAAGKEKTPALLGESLKRDAQVIRRWFS